MRTRRAVAGATYGYLHMAVVTLVGLWLTPFLLVRLGREELGLWLVIQQVLGYVLLMDFGVVAMLPREIAFATGRGGSETVPAEVADVAGRTARLVLWQTPVIAAVALLLWMIIPAGWTAVHGPAAVLLAVFVTLFPARVFQALLTGLQDLAFVGRVNLASWILNTLLTVWLVLAGYGLLALAAGWAAGQLLLVLACWIRLRVRYPQALPSRLPAMSARDMRSQFGRSTWISVAQVAQVLLNGSDLLIIGWVLGPVAVVPYACTAKLISVLANQPQLLMQAAAPALSEVRTSSSRERLENASFALTQAMLLLTGAVACVVAAVNEGFVNWWVGPANYGGLTLTILLIAGMVLRHWNTTTIYALFARGYDRHISLTTLADGAVTVLFSFAGVQLAGPAGAAAGAIAGSLLVSLPSNLTLLARDGETSVLRLATRLVPWVARFLPVLIGAVVIGFAWRPASLPHVALVAAAVALTYLLVTGPILFRAPLAGYVRPWLAWR